MLHRYIPELEQLVGGKFDEIRVEASPYLRTMMTAAQVCKGLGLTQFRTNYLFSEWQEDKIQYKGQN